MKRALHAIGIVLFVVYALLPVGTLIAAVFGYTFTAVKSPQRVYMGEWRAYEAMTLFWQDEHCLVINGESYTIE